MSNVQARGTPYFVPAVETYTYHCGGKSKEENLHHTGLSKEFTRMAHQYSKDRAVLNEALCYARMEKYCDALRVLTERKPCVDDCSLDKYEALISYTWFRLGDMRQALKAARAAVSMGLSSPYLDAVTTSEGLAPDE